MLAPRHCWGGHSAAAAIHSVACLWHCGWGSSSSVQASAACAEVCWAVLGCVLACAGPCWAVLGQRPSTAKSSCSCPRCQHKNLWLLSQKASHAPCVPCRTSGMSLQDSCCTCRSVLGCGGIGRSTPNLTCSCPRCQHDESLRVLLHPLPPAGPQARPSMSAHLDLACALYLRAAGSSSSAIW